MDNCIFLPNSDRELQANVVHEDEQVIALVPIDPVSIGHTLVIPKSHFENLVDIPVEALNDVVGVAKSIAMDLMAKKGATGINFLHATGKDAHA